MSDRSEHLRRQRELLREHLAWIERELAAEEGINRPSPVPPASPSPQDAAPADDRDAEAILSEYRRAPSSITRDTKRGCILYFALALGVIVLGVLAIYAFARRGR